MQLYFEYYYRSLRAAARFNRSDMEFTVISSTISCAKDSIVSLVTVDMTFLRCSRSTSFRLIHIQVDNIHLLTLTTQ